MKPRTLYFDILRILSCIMIVFMHAQKGDVGTPGWLLAGSGYVEAAGIGLFFMISGALVLDQKADFDTWLFLRKRIKKILIPLLFWYAIYTITQYIDYEYTGRGVLWFLWTIGGLYLLSPVLIRWLQKASDKEILYYLSLWVVSLLFPAFNWFMDVSVSVDSWIYYFSGYVGYYVLGYYLGHRVSCLTGITKLLIGILFLLASVVAPLAVLFLHIDIDFYEFFWYLSLPVVLQCVLWFLSCKATENRLQNCSLKCKSIIQWIASQTFGIYLTHILIMRGWLWKTEWIQSFHSAAHLIVCAFITFCLAMCFTAVLRKVPYVRMIVGG